MPELDEKTVSSCYVMISSLQSRALATGTETRAVVSKERQPMPFRKTLAAASDRLCYRNIVFKFYYYNLNILDGYDSFPNQIILA